MRTVLIAMLAACGGGTSPPSFDLDKIRVGEARLRTDAVGGTPIPAEYKLPSTCANPRDPQLVELCANLASTLADRKFTDNATFVLVDAENTSDIDAVVTLGGELRDGSGATLGELKAESLRIPHGETRTFALVDLARQPRPTASRAQIKLRGARIPEEPPVMHLEDVKALDDHGKLVVQATLVNDKDREGQAFVFAAFHGADHRPMTRPFSVYTVAANGKLNVQLVGPPGSTTANAYVGDTVY
jgi:hypothetical protein